MDVFVFVVSAAIILAGAAGVIVARHPVHSALFLIQTLFGVAVLFVLLEAHFLAAIQVIVYAGAIVILFLFVIMLLGVDTTENLGIEPIAGQRPLAAISGASIIAIVISAVMIATDTLGETSGASPGLAIDESISDQEQLGRVLFTDYVLAFEITGVLLTIAVVGAVVLSRRPRRSLEDELNALEGTAPPEAGA